MASEVRRTDPPLEEILFTEGFRFEFFQAVRLLERLYLERSAVGQDGRPSQEVVRFRSRVSLAFPPSEIYEIAYPEKEGEAPLMTVAFMGLAGSVGVLPRHYTELVLERTRERDFTLRDFLDLFNHRLISLFYRAWGKYRFPIGYERTALKKTGHDPFSEYLLSLIGMGISGLQNRLEVEDESLIFFAGPFAQQPHSASALERLLSDYLNAPVAVDQFKGAWLPLAQEDRTRLGTGPMNSQLGLNTFLGARYWDQQAKFRIRVGPLSYKAFLDLLPCGRRFRALVEIGRIFAGQELDFDVQLILKAAEVPGCELGQAAGLTPRLGWTSWLKTREFTRDAADAVLGSHLTFI